MNNVATRALLVFGGDAVARLCNFLAIVHFGRVLAPQYFGYVIIGMTTLQYAALAADLGLSTVGMRETARPPDSRRVSFGTLLSLRLLLATVVTALYEIVLALAFRSHPAYDVLALYGLAILPSALLIEWYYQGRKVLAPVTAARVAGGAVYVVVVLLMVHTPQDTPLVATAFAAGTLVSALLLLGWKTARPLPEEQTDTQTTAEPEHARRLLPTPAEALHLLRQSASVSLGGLFAQTVQLVPPLAAGWLLSAADAGRYGSAVKLLALVLMLDRVFNILFLPAVVRFWSMDRDRLHALIERALRLIVVGAWSMSTVLSVVAGSLIVRVFGPEFADAGPVLAVLSWFFALTMLNSVFTFSLIGAGHDRHYLTATVWGGSISALLILAGTALGGVVGTAGAVVLSEALITLMTYRAFRRFFSVRLVRHLLPATVLAAVCMPVCTALGLTAWWLAPLLWCAVLGLAAAFGLISRNDLQPVFRQ